MMKDIKTCKFNLNLGSKIIPIEKIFIDINKFDISPDTDGKRFIRKDKTFAIAGTNELWKVVTDFEVKENCCAELEVVKVDLSKEMENGKITGKERHELEFFLKKK